MYKSSEYDSVNNNTFLCCVLSCLQEQSSPTPDVPSEVTDDAEESPKESPPKVKTPRYTTDYSNTAITLQTFDKPICFSEVSGDQLITFKHKILYTLVTAGFKLVSCSTGCITRAREQTRASRIPRNHHQHPLVTTSGWPSLYAASDQPALPA